MHRKPHTRAFQPAGRNAVLLCRCLPQGSLITLGYICEELGSTGTDALAPQEVNQILTAVVAGMHSEEPVLETRLAATQALCDAVEFAGWRAGDVGGGLSQSFAQSYGSPFVHDVLVLEWSESTATQSMCLLLLAAPRLVAPLPACATLCWFGSLFCHCCS